jgi:hypothetical protein
VTRWEPLAIAFFALLCAAVFLRPQHHRHTGLDGFNYVPYGRYLPQHDKAVDWHCGPLTETPDGGFNFCPHVPNR